VDVLLKDAVRIHDRSHVEDVINSLVIGGRGKLQVCRSFARACSELRLSVRFEVFAAVLLRIQVFRYVTVSLSQCFPFCLGNMEMWKVSLPRRHEFSTFNTSNNILG
jgi:hypothetical protein